MNALPVEIARDFARAVELRATGISWQSVAEKLGRDLEEIRAWPDAYPDLWRASFESAELGIAADTSAESIAYLRILLRSKDERICAAAIRAMLKHRIDLLKLERQRAEQDALIANTPSEALTDDELIIYADELLYHLRPKLPEPLPAIVDRDVQ